jgi:FdhD protein
VVLNEHCMPRPGTFDRNFYTTSSCGLCGKGSIAAIRTVSSFTGQESPGPLVDRELLFSLPAISRYQQATFEETGGLHACTLFSHTGKLLFLREDVGRHNALDKLIGAAMVHNYLPMDRSVLLLSGRASFELIQKAAMAGIRIIAAIGAPSSLAVELAEEFQITLIGFLRGRRFNIYTFPNRITHHYENQDQR